MDFLIYSEINLPTGQRFITGTAAKSNISVGDFCEHEFDNITVRIEVKSIGMRTLDRMEADVDGYVVDIYPKDAPSLRGSELQFELAN